MVLLLAIPLGTAPDPNEPSPPVPLLRIVELLANPDPALLQREFIEILNNGSVAVEMAGWNVRDAGTNNFTFPAWTLSPGGRVVVWSNASSNELGPSWSTSAGKTVWNDAGDAATLRNPNGAIVDYFAYGSAGGTPPAGFESRPVPPAAPRGRSLRLDATGWTEAEPSPGRALPGPGGGASAEVQNLPPRLALAGLPQVVRQGTRVDFTVEVHDDNGDSDVKSWTVTDAGGSLAQGATAGRHDVTARAPTTPGAWILRITAADAAGARATLDVTVQVRDSVLQLELPPGGNLRFPTLRPGDRNITSLDGFVLRNDGTEPLRPVFDLSSFRGANGTFPALGNAWIGLAPAAATNATTTNADSAQWVPYATQLLNLPQLPAGAAWVVRLRIDAVPLPLSAGNYGTSFTVVA